jgi:pteridine reductase
MEEKVALITGAGKRVGACIARTLHEEGMKVVIHYGRSENEAKKLADELNMKRPNSAEILQADLNNLDDINLLAECTIKIEGRLDALINNASAFYPTKIGSITEDQWNELFNTNAKAPLFLAQAVAPYLKKTNGAIINMVDIHADRPLKDHPVYCMAKAALVAMTKSLARDLAPEVCVNAVAPGMILWPDEAMDEKTKSYILNRIPMGKPGSPEYIAETIAFLLKQDYITGQVVTIDGGRSLNV